VIKNKSKRKLLCVFNTIAMEEMGDYEHWEGVGRRVVLAGEGVGWSWVWVVDMWGRAGGGDKMGWDRSVYYT
jgi:hypothetical protein